MARGDSNQSLCATLNHTTGRGSSNMQCAEGYVGPICRGCATAYVPSGSACIACPGGSRMDLVFGFLVSICFVAFLAMLVMLMRLKTEKKMSKVDIDIINATG